MPVQPNLPQQQHDTRQDYINPAKNKGKYKLVTKTQIYELVFNLVDTKIKVQTLKQSSQQNIGIIIETSVTLLISLSKDKSI